MTNRQPLTDVAAIQTALRLHNLTLRSITDADLPTLCQIYGSTRTDELAQTGWSVEQQTAFLTMQFNAQHRYYMEHYVGAAWTLIERDGLPIGRLYLIRWARELRIVDIALLPQDRSQGIGSAILRAIIDEGERLRLPITIHVEMFNPALRLYERLGFKQIADKGVYYLMERTPDA
jgi:ribosomal protein S18 acetylase RimI-like enzyme